MCFDTKFNGIRQLWEPELHFEIRTSYLLLGRFQLSQHVSDLINTSKVFLLYQLRKADAVRVHYSVSINI